MNKAVRQNPFPWRLDWIVIINSMMMLLYHATGVNAVNLIGNAFSAAVVLYLSIAAIGSTSVLKRYGLLLAVLGCSLAGTLIVNIGKTDAVDLLKYTSLFALYFAAGVSPQKLRCSYVSATALVLIPLVLLPFGSRVYVNDSLSGASFSYFQTYNAAALYYTAVAFYLYPILGKYTLPIQLAAVIAFGKIGAILATGISFGAWHVKLNARSIGVLIVGMVIVLLAYWFGLFTRVVDVVGPLWKDLLRYGPTRISRMTYAEIVHIAGTTDISGYFRIKHWLEIWNHYWGSGIQHILFGYGPGQTKFTTTLKLVPHNDYLRILVEFGVFNFICFLILIVTAVRNLPNSTVKTLFTVYIIYSFTDNIIDNFTSIVLLLGGAGLYSRSTRGQRKDEVTRSRVMRRKNVPRPPAV